MINGTLHGTAYTVAEMTGNGFQRVFHMTEAYWGPQGFGTLIAFSLLFLFAWAMKSLLEAVIGGYKKG